MVLWMIMNDYERACILHTYANVRHAVLLAYVLLQTTCQAKRVSVVNNRVFPVSSEIADLLLFVSYFASQSKGIKFGDNFFDVYCVNSEVLG